MSNNRHKPEHIAHKPQGLSVPWAIAFACMVCVIWGNSLVPGEGSGSLSLSVLETVRGALGAVHLPYEWLTHHMVRKAAHFTEHLVLALLGMQALRPHRLPKGRRLARAAATAIILEAVPMIDETIQLFVDGRAGQATDVLIDSCGLAAGVALTLGVGALRRKRGR